MRASAHCVWPVSHPRWVACVRGGVVVAAMAGLLYCLPWPYVVIVALLLALLRRIERRRVCVAPAGTLCCAGQGRWAFARARHLPYHDLRLVRAWLGAGWVTLRFAGRGSPEFKDTMLQITIWKTAIEPDAWRRLRMCVARCIARPEPAPARVGL
jgi:hypothetical protein